MEFIELDTVSEVDTDNFYIGCDSMEDIQKCLHCNKPDCNNCLKYQNNC